MRNQTSIHRAHRDAPSPTPSAAGAAAASERVVEEACAGSVDEG